jgi:hypothetical protein
MPLVRWRSLAYGPLEMPPSHPGPFEPIMEPTGERRPYAYFNRCDPKRSA